MACWDFLRLGKCGGEESVGSWDFLGGAGPLSRYSSYTRIFYELYQLKNSSGRATQNTVIIKIENAKKKIELVAETLIPELDVNTTLVT